MMKKDRQQQIEQQIEKVFNNVTELYALLKTKDYEWANKIVNSDDETYDDNCELAESILNVGDNLKDWGKEFIK
jgi:hypothetical protein